MLRWRRAPRQNRCRAVNVMAAASALAGKSEREQQRDCATRNGYGCSHFPPLKESGAWHLYHAYDMCIAHATCQQISQAIQEVRIEPTYMCKISDFSHLAYVGCGGRVGMSAIQYQSL